MLEDCCDANFDTWWGKAKTHPAGPLISNAFIKYRSIPPTVKMPKILFVDFMLSLNVDLAKIKNQQNTCNIVTGTIRWLEWSRSFVLFTLSFFQDAINTHDFLIIHTINSQPVMYHGRIPKKISLPDIKICAVKKLKPHQFHYSPGSQFIVNFSPFPWNVEKISKRPDERDANSVLIMI